MRQNTYSFCFYFSSIILFYLTRFHIKWRFQIILIWFLYRRQVFWISKQILQLVMEDAVDDLLLREICWLRNEDTVAQGIRWAQDVRTGFSLISF